MAILFLGLLRSFSFDWEGISNTRDSVLSAIQTPPISSKILCCMLYFQLSSKCLDISMKHCLLCLMYYLENRGKQNELKPPIANGDWCDLLTSFWPTYLKWCSVSWEFFFDDWQQQKVWPLTADLNFRVHMLLETAMVYHCDPMHVQVVKKNWWYGTNLILHLFRYQKHARIISSCVALAIMTTQVS